MFKTTYEKPVFVLDSPVEVALDESETFIIEGIKYTVKPDVVGKVIGGKDGRYWLRPLKGFAGREFVIQAFDGRRIVTRNLWMGEDVDSPDTAEFVGAVAKPVQLSRHHWEWR